MHWSEIRKTYPDQWLVIEVLEAHTTPTQKRQLDQVAVIESGQDGATVMPKYREYHQHYPLREYYFVHTSREDLDIRVHRWLGVRTANRIAA